MALDGRCLCGAVTVHSEGDALMTFLCHCTDCRRQTSGVASLIVLVERPGLTIAGDTIASWETTGTESGAERERLFCSRCGSMLATYIAETDQIAAIKAGVLDAVADLVPDGEMWCESALQWWPDPGEERGQFPRGVPMG
jgi:hypothetical protein